MRKAMTFRQQAIWTAEGLALKRGGCPALAGEPDNRAEGEI